MKNIGYIDALFHEILKADSKERLLYIEDDIGIAIGLKQIPDQQDIRLLKLALQMRYSYILFNEILVEVGKLNNIENGPELVDRFQKEIDTINKSHLVLLDDMK